MVPLTAGQGTWRQSGAFRAADWHIVPSSLPRHLAATLSVKCVPEQDMHGGPCSDCRALECGPSWPAVMLSWSDLVSPSACQPLDAACIMTAADSPVHSCSPVSAMRMLEEFVELREGDVVIQNGGNSAVGRAIIQFAHAQGEARQRHRSWTSRCTSTHRNRSCQRIILSDARSFLCIAM